MMAPDAPPAEQNDGSVASQISKLVVKTLTEYTGRGPVSAHTTFHGDLIITLLRDALTKGERSLASNGSSLLVIEMRKAFQMTMRDDLVAGVEAIVGRPVIAFLSDNHIDPDLGVEMFVLAPSEAG